MDKVKQGNFLALCLLDALEDCNKNNCLEFLINHKTDPNHIVYDRGIAAIHYVCGMENINVANEIMRIMLEFGGDPNLPTVDDEMTPMHLSAMYGNLEIFELLLERGGNVNQADCLNRLPIHYAIFEEHFDIVKRIQNHTSELRSQKLNSVKDKKTERFPHSKIQKSNFIEMSRPYSKNITDDKMINLSSEGTETVNIFTLTKENLSEFSKKLSPRKSTKSIVNTWREKVQRSKSRKSILATYENVDSLLNDYIANEHYNFSNTDITEHVDDGNFFSLV